MREKRKASDGKRVPTQIRSALGEDEGRREMKWIQSSCFLGGNINIMPWGEEKRAISKKALKGWK